MSHIKQTIMAGIVLSTAALNVSHSAPLFDKMANDVAGVNQNEPTAAEKGLTELVNQIDPMDLNLGAVQEAFDNSANTDNIKRYTYSQDVTYKIRTRVGMRTLIHLDEGESMFSFLVGNDKFFSAAPIKSDEYERGYIPNMITVKGIYAGADTNLTLLTESGKVYNFYVRSDPVDSRHVPHLTVYIENKPEHAAPQLINIQKSNAQPETTAMLKGEETPESINKKITEKPFLVTEKQKSDYLKSIDEDDNINTEYTIKGDADIEPYAVYDNGTFTYFDFRNGLPSDRLPVIYKVIDGYDTITNLRFENGFYIAESISTEGWTLKSGKKYVCIRHKGNAGQQHREKRKLWLNKKYRAME